MQRFPELTLPILVAFALLSFVMMAISSRFTAGADLHGLKSTQLGLAVELAADQHDFERMVPPPNGRGASSATSNRSWLRRQQYADFLYIALYVALFWLLGGVEMSAGFPGALLVGAAARAAIVFAGAFDVMEDLAILSALRGDPITWPIRNFGLPKWALFFLAVLLIAVWFLYCGLHPLTAGGMGGMKRALATLIGLLFAAGGLLGVTGVTRVDGVFLFRGTLCLIPAMLALLGLLVAQWRGI